MINRRRISNVHLMRVRENKSENRRANIFKE